MRKEILFVGVGGQGLVTSSILLGKAAMKEGLNSVQAQTYGSASRGGLARGDNVISNKEIDFPRILNADVGVFLDQEKYNKFNDLVKDDGLVIYDSDLVDIQDTNQESFGVKFMKTAEGIGNKMTANVVVLGALMSKIDFLETDMIEEILEKSFSDEVLKMNKKAFRKGLNLNKD